MVREQLWTEDNLVRYYRRYAITTVTIIRQLMDNNLPGSGQKSDMPGNWLKMNLDLQVKKKLVKNG